MPDKKKTLDKALQKGLLGGRSAKGEEDSGQESKDDSAKDEKDTPRGASARRPRAPPQRDVPRPPEAPQTGPEAGPGTDGGRQEEEGQEDEAAEAQNRKAPDRVLAAVRKGLSRTRMREVASSPEVDALKERDAPHSPRERQGPDAAEAPARGTPGVARTDPDAAHENGADSKAPKERQQPSVSQAPPHMRDEKFLQRARSREEKARKGQAKEEARRMREEAKAMLRQARDKEKRQNVVEAHQERVATVGIDLGYDPERPITRIPALKEGYEEVAFRVIEEDRAFIRMSYDSQDNRYLYEVIEPRLTPDEAKVTEFLRDTLIRTLDGRRGDDTDWRSYLRDAVLQAIVDHDILVDAVSTERILYYLVRDFLGYGPVDVLMQDDQLEDISCDGPAIPIYIFHRKYESLRTNIVFEEDLDIDSFVIRLAQRSGKHISIADPLLDATLPDGSRLQATLSREVTSRGSSFTVRKFREEPFTPPDLIDLGTMSTPMAAYFWFLIEEGRSFIYAGGTASGKTTSLNAVSQFIPPEKKIVTIEDTREINLMHENWIAGVTRSGFGGELASGKRAGNIDMYRLLEAALRQRPEYLIVGEVRGPEALTLFQAMATGHAVYSTMHADSAMSAVYRLENPPINVPRMMLQTLDIIAIQSQVRVGGQMGRRVREVVEMVGFDPDTEDLLTNTVFYWDSAKDRHVFTGHSSVFDEIQDKKGWDDDAFQQEWERRMEVLEWMRHMGIRHFRDFARNIHEYYKRPDRLLQRIADDGFTMDMATAGGTRPGDTSEAFRRDDRFPGAGSIPAHGADDGDEATAAAPPWRQAAEAMDPERAAPPEAQGGSEPAREEE